MIDVGFFFGVERNVHAAENEIRLLISNLDTLISLHFKS